MSAYDPFADVRRILPFWSNTACSRVTRKRLSMVKPRWSTFCVMVRDRDDNYGEGTVFLVPLADGGFAPGLIARIAPRKVTALGYFFGPRYFGPCEIECLDLAPSRVVYQKFFGDLGLWQGDWPILGEHPQWNRSAWPMIRTMRRPLMGSQQPILVERDPDDPTKIVSERRMEEDVDLQDDGLAGAGFVEKVLNRLLD